MSLFLTLSAPLPPTCAASVRAPRSRWDVLSGAGCGRRAGYPLPGAVLEEGIRDVPRPRVSVARGARAGPLPAAAAWRLHSLSREGTVWAWGGSPRSPSPTLQSRAAVSPSSRLVETRGCASWSCVAGGGKQPYSVIEAWLVPQNVSIYCSGGEGRGKDQEDGKGATGEEGGKQELEVP